MARQLTAGVVVRHPGTGAATFLPAGQDLPEWAIGRVGDHVLSGERASGAAGAAPVDGPPPRSGTGSGDAAWTAYARSHGVPVTDQMKRAEVIAACAAAGVATG